MEKSNENFGIRSMNDGNWYWVSKSVIQDYTPKVGAIGIVVYSFLASLADSEQSCFPSQKYIAEHLGFSRATVNKAIKLLEEQKLIKKVKKGQYNCGYILLRCKADETQVSTTGNSGVSRIDTNDNKLTRSINNIDYEDKKILFVSFKNFTPRTREEVLAVDLARGLCENQNLALYITFARKYPEDFLRRTLGEVKEIPHGKIKKSRGALFNYLIQKHAKETNNNLRD